MAGTQILKTLNVNQMGGKNQTVGKNQNKKNASTDFSGLMRQCGISNSNMPGTSGNDKAQTVVNSDKTKPLYDSGNNHVQPVQETSLKERIAELNDELSETADQITGTVAENFGMDPKDVEKAMEVLGMTAFDLLQPQNLTALVQKLTGQEEPAELLLDANFQNTWQELGQIANDVMSQLGITSDDLTELTNLMEPVDTSDAIEGLEQLPENETFEKTVLPAENDSTQEEALFTETVGEAGQTRETEALQKDQTGTEKLQSEQSPKEPQSENIRTQNGVEKQPENARSGSGNSQMGEQHAEASGDTSKTVVTGANTVAQTTFEESLVQPENNQPKQVDTLDVIRQIAEQTRVTITQDVSSMEMQLRPENLGRIYLEVTMKEGAVHAQLAAQDEAVKEALQAQIATLQEKLDQAGIRVDAIEVTVASHEFERNLEQNEHQGDAKQDMDQGHRNRKSGFTEGVSDGQSSVISEEDALTAQIRRDNGNSVDLTA